MAGNLGSEAEPEYIIWCYFEGNDLDDLRSESLDPLLRGYLDKAGFSQNLTHRVSDISHVLRSYVEKDGTIERVARYSSSFLSWFKLRALRARFNVLVKSRFRSEQRLQKHPELVNNIDSRTFATGELKRFSRVLSAAKKESEDHDAKLLFVYLPSWQGLMGNENSSSRRHVLSIVESLNIPLIDVTSWFKKYDDPLGFFARTAVEYGHYTERGYELVSSAIVEAVRK